jgi:hypothetical protein
MPPGARHGLVVHHYPSTHSLSSVRADPQRGHAGGRSPTIAASAPRSAMSCAMSTSKPARTHSAAGAAGRYRAAQSRHQPLRPCPCARSLPRVSRTTRGGSRRLDGMPRPGFNRRRRGGRQRRGRACPHARQTTIVLDIAPPCVASTSSPPRLWRSASPRCCRSPPRRHSLGGPKATTSQPKSPSSSLNHRPRTRFASCWRPTSNVAGVSSNCVCFCGFFPLGRFDAFNHQTRDFHRLGT